MPTKCKNCKKKFRTHGLSYMIMRRLCSRECRREYFNVKYRYSRADSIKAAENSKYI